MSLPIPGWAQGPIESFKQSQTLPGTTRKAVPASEVAGIDESIRTNVDEVISADESSEDGARNQPNKLKLFDGVLEAEWTGDTRQGTFVETIKGDGGSAFVFAEFTADSASMVMLSNEGGQVSGTARHANRAHPEQSFELVADPAFRLAR